MRIVQAKTRNLWLGSQAALVASIIAGLSVGGSCSMIPDTTTQSTVIPIRVEAESMTKTTYRIESQSSASGGKVLSLLYGDSKEIGTASFAFAGPSGTYNIVVDYYDENDGVAQLEIKLGDTILDSWNLNLDLGSHLSNAQTLLKRLVSPRLFVPQGATIQIKGTETQLEHARIDYIDFIPVGSSQDALPLGTRDKWLWPFASTSPWNMPIGSNARYTPANIQKAAWVVADVEYLYKIKAGDPVRSVYVPGSWGPGRCTGTAPQGKLQVPDNLIVPDATQTSTPNNPAAFLLPDEKTFVQLNPLTRCTSGGNVYGWRTEDVSIYGDGLRGGHGGSGLSSIGGSIRLGELTGTRAIRHALKINLWADKYLHYSSSNPGYRWPADRADNYAAKNYKGTNPKLVMGSLLAIPPNVTEASLGLQTPAGRKLFHALQNYGGYVVDDSAGDAHYLSVEKGVLEQFRATYGYDFGGTSGVFYDDIMKLFKALYIVDNNGPDNVGGGGKPRVSMAPPIGN